jgi:hypothetical protein
MTRRVVNHDQVVLGKNAWILFHLINKIKINPWFHLKLLITSFGFFIKGVSAPIISHTRQQQNWYLIFLLPPLTEWFTNMLLGLGKGTCVPYIFQEDTPWTIGNTWSWKTGAWDTLFRHPPTTPLTNHMTAAAALFSTFPLPADIAKRAPAAAADTKMRPPGQHSSGCKREEDSWQSYRRCPPKCTLLLTITTGSETLNFVRRLIHHLVMCQILTYNKFGSVKSH